MLLRMMLVLLFLTYELSANTLKIDIPLSFVVGRTYNLKATVITDDEEMIDVTNQVTWSVPEMFSPRGLSSYEVNPLESSPGTLSRVLRANVFFDGEYLSEQQYISIDNNITSLNIRPYIYRARVGSSYNLSVEARFGQSYRTVNVTQRGFFTSYCGWVSSFGYYRPNREKCYENIRFNYGGRSASMSFYVE